MWTFFSCWLFFYRLVSNKGPTMTEQIHLHMFLYKANILSSKQDTNKKETYKYAEQYDKLNSSILLTDHYCYVNNRLSQKKNREKEKQN